jgi:hypothetical protein
MPLKLKIFIGLSKENLLNQLLQSVLSMMELGGWNNLNMLCAMEMGRK